MPRWNLRRVPSTRGNAPVETARRADEEVFRVMARRGVWLRLQRDDGTEVWAHSRGLRVETLATNPPGTPVARAPQPQPRPAAQAGAADVLRGRAQPRR